MFNMHRQQHRSSKCAGYSCLQLVLVLIIIITVLLIATPPFRKLHTQYKLRTSIIMLQQLIQLAQHTAIQHKATVLVKVIDNPRPALVLLENDALIKKVILPQLDELFWHGFGHHKPLTVLPNGFTFNNGHFELRVRAQICLIFVNNALKSRYACPNIP